MLVCSKIYEVLLNLLILTSFWMWMDQVIYWHLVAILLLALYKYCLCTIWDLFRDENINAKAKIALFFLCCKCSKKKNKKTTKTSKPTLKGTNMPYLRFPCMLRRKKVILVSLLPISLRKILRLLLQFKIKLELNSAGILTEHRSVSYSNSS